MTKRIIAGLAMMAGLAAPASASAASPRINMDYAKHVAWETQQDYIERISEWSEVDEEKFSCRRISRAVIDCKVSQLFYDNEHGCVAEEIGKPGDDRMSWENCEEGERYAYWWRGERHSWTMRFRAGQALYTVHTNWYFPADRYADTDATSYKFGGRAINKTGEYGEIV